MAKTSAQRSFGLSSEDAKALQEAHRKTRDFPNPYRSGAYHFIVAALAKLGVNKAHPLAKVHEAFKRAAGDDWYKEWARKDKRNDKTGKDADARFVQNLHVLQRTKDYGLKLLQAGRRVLKTKGCVIDLARDSKRRLMVCLNTRSATPRKAGRPDEKKPKVAKTAVRAKSKRRRKAASVAPSPAPNRDHQAATVVAPTAQAAEGKEGT